MAETTKPMSEKDYQQTLRGAYNDVDKSLTVNGFVGAKIGHKITLAIQTTTVASDTELYTFFDGATQLMQIKIIYTTSTRDLMLSVERIA